MEKKYLLPSGVYDVLKWLCLIGLPSMGWAYGALAAKWGWPMADQIVATFDIVGTLIGLLIGVSQLTAREVHDA